MIELHLSDKPGYIIFVNPKDFKTIEITSDKDICVHLKIFGNYGMYKVSNSLDSLLAQVKRAQNEDKNK